MMNPSTMQLCGFYIGGLCVVNKTYIRMCWPCSSVSLSSVALFSGIEDCKQGQHISIEQFVDPVQQALEVTLTSRYMIILVSISLATALTFKVGKAEFSLVWSVCPVILVYIIT